MVFSAHEIETKAETLQRLAARLTRSDVPRLLYWTVREWRAHRAEILAVAIATFGQRVAVRSATRYEDRPNQYLAGHYRTELGVVSEAAPLGRAIERVIDSYGEEAADHHVLVQAMVDDARRSGVVLTRDPATGAAYDVIEFEEGRDTDAVTGGWGRPLRVAIHRDADPEAVARSGLGAIVAATREIESLSAAGALDLEMVERGNSTIALVQVRWLALLDPEVAERDRVIAARLARLAVRVETLARPSPRIAGATSVLGMMPDWNPAELIGAHPSPLAAALFRSLISDRTWQEARAAMGYQPVAATPLMHLLAGRPYIDTRASFNSFLPAGLPMGTRATLVDAWMDWLRIHPELHDRVELEVAQTAFDFETVSTFRRRVGARLAPSERDAWLTAMRGLTRRVIDVGSEGSLSRALRRIARLTTAWPGARPPEEAPPLRATLDLLARCRVDGARPFAVIARHAFMAEGFVRSLVGRGALSPERALALRRSLTTVAGRFAADWARVARGRWDLADFLTTYGHLRPGAFDITSLPYARRDPSFWDGASVRTEKVAPFVASAAERTALERLLAEARLDVDAPTLLAWMAAAIVGREHGKFLLTRGLSAALEGLAAWGAARGFGRDDVAQLTIANLRHIGARSDAEATRWLAARVVAARARAAEERVLRLGPLVRDPQDLFVVYEPPVMPTFVTNRTVVAPPLALDGREVVPCEVRGRIACIESADPGFDWLFGRSVSGLVTRFGGANSHMAIRCIELGVPAALGVGESAFARLRRAPMIELRCGERAVRAVGASDLCGR
jgi:hypothetical protein